MDNNNLNKNLLNSAAISGVYLGLYFLLKYILYIYMIPNFILSVPYYMLTVFVPVIVYFLMKDFKKKNSHIEITFGTMWRYGVLLYLFGSIISMFAHYYYYKFRFINNMYAVKNMLEQYVSSASMSTKMSDLLDESIMQAVNTPTYQLVLNDFASNMISGAIVSLIITLILRKK